jgi:hypothetical protein
MTRDETLGKAEVLPRLRAIAGEPGGLVRLANVVGMSERRLRDVLKARSTPRPGVAQVLSTLAKTASPSAGPI